MALRYSISFACSSSITRSHRGKAKKDGASQRDVMCHIILCHVSHHLMSYVTSSYDGQRKMGLGKRDPGGTGERGVEKD